MTAKAYKIEHLALKVDWAFLDQWPILTIAEEVNEAEDSRSKRVIISYPFSQLKLYHTVILNGKTLITNK